MTLRHLLATILDHLDERIDLPLRRFYYNPRQGVYHAPDLIVGSLPDAPTSASLFEAARIVRRQERTGRFAPGGGRLARLADWVRGGKVEKPVKRAEAADPRVNCSTVGKA